MAREYMRTKMSGTPGRRVGRRTGATTNNKEGAGRSEWCAANRRQDVRAVRVQH